MLKKVIQIENKLTGSENVIIRLPSPNLILKKNIDINAITDAENRDKISGSPGPFHSNWRDVNFYKMEL